jgi:lipid A 3-O-deacylase
MHGRLNPVLALAAALALATGTAVAAQAGELFAGVYTNRVDVGVAVCCAQSGADIELGYRTAALKGLARLGDWRLYAMGSVNTSGGVDFAAAGIAWRLHLTKRLYAQAGIGGAVQDGAASQIPGPKKQLYLGSRLLFEPEATLGVVQTPRWSAEASYLHLSHGYLAGKNNPGLDDLGVRVVYRFGGQG